MQEKILKRTHCEEEIFSVLSGGNWMFLFPYLEEAIGNRHLIMIEFY